MFYRQRIRSDSKYLTDESKMTGKGEHVIIPVDESELREAMRINNSKGNPVTVSAMRTGVCGGCVPLEGDVISLERMSGVLGIGRDDRGYFVRVLPCTTIEEINRVLRTRDFSSLADVTEGAGAVLAAEPVPYFYPVDPTEMSGSIGGNIACNASGPRTYRYGPTRDWVRRLMVVMPDGQFVDFKRGDYKAEGRRMSFPAGRSFYSFEIPSYDFNTDVKNAAGPMFHSDMDLIDMFVGSEGIFGIIAEADVYIAPWHPLVSSILFFPTDGDCLAAVREFRGDDLIDPEFLEYMDGRSLDLVRGVMASDPAMIRVPRIPDDAGSALFFDMAVTGDMRARFERVGEIASRHGSSLSESWCADDDQGRARMRELRHSIPRSVFEYVASLKGEMPGIHKMGTDMSVPDDAADEMMDYYRSELDSAGLEYVVFGHIGNNHPHVEIILKSMEDFEKAQEVYDRFARRAVELGGSPSAEHGIGKIKTRYMELMYGREGVEQIRRIKAILDPKDILCRGNITGGSR